MTDRSSLTKNLNMVSSDTIKDKNAPQNPRIRTNTNSRMNKPANEELTNFKQINKTPYREVNSVHRYNIFKTID